MDVSESDIKFALNIDVDIRGLSKKVAVAAIEDKVRHLILNQPIDTPSERQIDLAHKLGVDLGHCSKNMASVKISDKLDKNNRDSVERQKLKPGDKVRKIYGDMGHTYTISSIQPNGVVWFKGGQGSKSWASNVEKLNA